MNLNERNQSQDGFTATPGPSYKPPQNNYRVNYSGGDNAYSDTMAALSRQQYQDWLNRFAPTEERLIDLATSDELYDQQKERNQKNAALNLEQAEQSAANSGARYGLSDRRTDQQKNNLQLTNALSLASMNNEGRQAIGDLQRHIISGASTGAKQKINAVGGQ